MQTSAKRSFCSISAPPQPPQVPPPPGASSAVTVVGIAGGSGSGKTVFCANLCKLLKQAGTDVAVLPHDM